MASLTKDTLMDRVKVPCCTVSCSTSWGHAMLHAGSELVEQLGWNCGEGGYRWRSKVECYPKAHILAWVANRCLEATVSPPSQNSSSPWCVLLPENRWESFNIRCSEVSTWKSSAPSLVAKEEWHVFLLLALSVETRKTLNVGARDEKVQPHPPNSYFSAGSKMHLDSWSAS